MTTGKTWDKRPQEPNIACPELAARLRKERSKYVDEVFGGLSEFIKDKDIFEWYKSLIIDAIDYHSAYKSADGGEPLQPTTKYGQRGGICLCEIAIMFPDKDLKCKCDGNLI